MEQKEKQELNSRLSAVINTLNSIEVKGKDNLYNLYACIQVVIETQQMIENIGIKENDNNAE